MGKSFTKLKIFTGLITFYGSSEAFLHYKTQKLINDRKNEIQKALDTDNEVDPSKFKSATIAGMFINPFEEYRPQTGFEFMFVRVLELIESFHGNKIELHDHLPDDHTVEDYLKVHKPDLETLRSNSMVLKQCLKNGDMKHMKAGTGGWFSRGSSVNDQMLFTWLGQSCSLVQISGINILTDPILSDHLLTPHFGPKRLNKSPMDLEDIKYATNNNLDFVMVSHDHPDHLENDLIGKIGNKSTWIVPLGLKKTFARKGVVNVVEMDWWDSVDLNQFMDAKIKDKYELVCVPSMHWSGRYVVDANFSLWCSYILRKNGKSVLYHAGDTGYSKELFDIVGKKYGPVDLSLLPIGQYCPSWHQKPRHISPEESLQICNQLNSKHMMGIHWGTFKLSSEPILQPKTLLTSLSKNMGKEHNYRVPEFGITYLFNLSTK